jgi:hypothetical protein
MAHTVQSREIGFLQAVELLEALIAGASQRHRSRAGRRSFAAAAYSPTSHNTEEVDGQRLVDWVTGLHVVDRFPRSFASAASAATPGLGAVVSASNGALMERGSTVRVRHRAWSCCPLSHGFCAGANERELFQRRRSVHPIRGRARDISWVGATMKVLEGLKAIEPGTAVPVAELGLPVTGTKGLLLVFWKST